MGPPPGHPWHRRYWTTYNRPYGGCGCLYTILVILLIWWLMSWFFHWHRWYHW